MTLSRRGRVVTSTVIHVSPTEFQMEAPYPMALVETPEGARLMVQVADCEPDAVRPGMEVALEFRRIRKEGRSGILCYGHKAVPVG
ncbi:MAG: OB-fold domain-containing protein [Gemmatimonadota bacterium]|nr:OB-fold domain-containing protein [Gemmatimonadota bacterium]